MHARSADGEWRGLVEGVAEKNREGGEQSKEKLRMCDASHATPCLTPLLLSLARTHTTKHPDRYALKVCQPTPVISGLQHDAARRDVPKG